MRNGPVLAYNNEDNVYMCDALRDLVPFVQFKKGEWYQITQRTTCQYLPQKFITMPNLSVFQ